ncbi:MAG: hypothetical protein ACJA0H_000305 [Francisellaceae bacterium]|jgi:hypothetical protein
MIAKPSLAQNPCRKNILARSLFIQQLKPIVPFFMSTEICHKLSGGIGYPELEKKIVIQHNGTSMHFHPGTMETCDTNAFEKVTKRLKKTLFIHPRSTKVTLSFTQLLERISSRDTFRTPNINHVENAVTSAKRCQVIQLDGLDNPELIVSLEEAHTVIVVLVVKNELNASEINRKRELIKGVEGIEQVVLGVSHEPLLESSDKIHMLSFIGRDADAVNAIKVIEDYVVGEHESFNEDSDKAYCGNASRTGVERCPNYSEKLPKKDMTDHPRSKDPLCESCLETI